MAIRTIGQTSIGGQDWQICQCSGFTSSKRRRSILVNGYPGYWAGKTKRAFADALTEWYQKKPKHRHIDLKHRLAVDVEGQRVYYMVKTWDAKVIHQIEAILGFRKPIDSVYKDLTLPELVNYAKRQRFLELKGEADKIRRDIQEAEKLLRGSITTYIDLCNDGGLDVETVVAQALEKLSDMEKVEKFELTERGELVVFTNHIFCKPRETDRDIRHIGKFKITIVINKKYSNTTIKYYNLTRKLSGYHSPHVPHHGAPCWGEATRMLKSLYESFMIPELVVVLIQFVESVNLEDAWGKRIWDWPKVSKAEMNKLLGKTKPKTKRVAKPKTAKATRKKVREDVEDQAQTIYAKFMELIGWG